MRPELDRLRTPCYVLDRYLFLRNLEILSSVQNRTGCKILLALKGFALWGSFDLAREHLAGTAASSLHEARLGRETFDKEVHVYSPAYRDDEFDAILGYADHVIFNSTSQWRRFRERVRLHDAQIQMGLRINPGHSEITTPLCDPCAPGSRLGTSLSELDGDALAGLSGLHFHNLCESNSDALERTLRALESKASTLFHNFEWVNFGGGHHITRADYDIDRLCRLVAEFGDRYGVTVYLEPGEAVALNSGVFIASVLDIVHHGLNIAILDTSAAAHMPDVLEMPYRPNIEGAGEPGRFPHSYRLGGVTCLAGDIIGEYSFPQPLHVGSKLVFHDMAHYTMVKNNTFNGIRLPDIAIHDPRDGTVEVVREFTYDDYKNRLS